MRRLVLATLIIGAGLALVGSWEAAAQTQAAQTPAVTFTKDVAPILQRSCQKCHRPDAMAPMSLLTYEDMRPWARTVRTNVTTPEMPPSYLVRTVLISKYDYDA